MAECGMSAKTGHVGTQATDKTVRGAMERAGMPMPAEAAEAPPIAEAPGAPPMQTALVFGADGSAMVTAEPASVRRRHHRGIRDDARRTAEYIASRGATPAEQLHNIGRMQWRNAIAQITKATGCTRLEAFRLWVSINESLLPYTAARLATLELGEGAAGGLALAHFLAASAMSERLAAGGPSLDRQSIDKVQTLDLALENGPLPSDVTRPSLPPKGKD
jgi:hypothetical protein